MAGIKIVDLPPLGRDLASTDLLELSLAGGTGSRKITGQEIMNASKLSVNNTPIINGTVGRILFQGTGNVLQQSSNLFWDNTNLIFTLGSTATRIFNFRPEDTTGAYGNSCSIRGGNGNGRLDFYSATNITEVRDNIILLTSVGGPSIQVGVSSISLNVASSTRLQVASTTGNVLIGTTTDAGFKLDVNGTARATKVAIGAATSSPYQLNIWGGAIESYISLNNTNSGNSTTDGFQIGLEPNGTDVYFLNRENGFIQFRTNNLDRLRIFSTGNVGINTTTDDGFKLDVNGTARVQDNLTVVRNQNTSTGVFISNTQNSASSAAAINLTSSSGDASFAKKPALGSVYKTISGNDAYIYNGTSGDISILNDTTGRIKFAAGASSTAQMTLFDTGNVGINTTTDAGYRLDVNGTARVATNLTVSTAGNGNMNTFLGGSVAIGSDWVNDGYILKIKANNTGVAGIYSRAGGASGYPILFCQDANGTTSTTFIVRENGNVIIGATANIASSKLTIDSTTQGFLPPRMTQAQRNAIASPAIGLEIYQTDATEGKYIYKSSGWTYIG